MEEEGIVLDCLASSGGDGPDANTHPKAPKAGSFIESNFDEPSVSGENVTELVHGCTPSEPLIDMVKNIGRICFTNFAQEILNLTA
ncbi:hypothetical protein N8951_00445 [bacterium]|nr:hypothetical protein [bacterium]